MATATKPAPAPVHVPDVVDQLTQIPKIMSKLGWLNAATLMNNWFAGPPNPNRDLSAPDTSTIKMDSWVLKFARARKVYDEMVAERVWINEAAKNLRIIPLIKKAKLLQSTPTQFGNLSMPMTIQRHKELHINTRTVSLGLMAKVIDPLDDMFGALGAFEIACAIEAQIAPIFPKDKTEQLKHQVTIPRVGFYVRDDFDFPGSESLGFWDFKNGNVSKGPYPGYEEVTDEHFRQWRDRNHHGNDYWVYSDVKILNLSPAQSFTINE